MYNRTLKRPMFRMGGSAGTGITSGLDTPKRGRVDGPGGYAGFFGSEAKEIAKNATERAEQSVKELEALKRKRKLSNPFGNPGGGGGNSSLSALTQKHNQAGGYNVPFITNNLLTKKDIGTAPSDFEIMKEQRGDIPTPSKYPYKASDFFMNLGAGIMAQPGGQPIFQTIGKASIPALGELQKAQQSDWGLGEKGKLEQWKSDQELLLAAYKNTSEDEKNKMWEEAHAMFDNKGINPYTKEKFKTPQEAYNLLLKNKFMSKEKVLTPEAQYNTTYEKIFTKHLQNQDFGGNSAAAANLAKHEANIIYEKYPKEVIDQFNLTQLWIDPAFYDEKDGVKTMNEIGEISALGIETGKIYLNLPDGNFYKLGPNKIFEQVSLTDLQG